jgi:two-component system cell cycle response regulator
MPAQDTFKKISLKIGKLPTIPGVAMQIIQAMRRERPDLREIAEIISADAPLSAEVLKAVNSPFYGLLNPVTSVHHAMLYLGLNTVRNLALSFSLLKRFAPKQENAFDYLRFSKGSLIAAVASKLIAEKVSPEDGENAFFLGLFQNIGMLVLAEAMPDQYEKVIVEAKSGAAAWHDVESRLLGFNHMQVGEYVTNAWGLPASFTVPIGSHHCPEQLTHSSGHIIYMTNILHLSSLYIDMFNSSNPGAAYAEIDKFIRAYELSSIIDAAAVAEQIAKDIRNIFPIFEIEIDEKKCIDIIEAARNQLVDLSDELLSQVHSQSQELNQLKLEVGLDGLTQLTNHKRFLEILQHEVSRATRYKTPLSLIMADVDHFKPINDFFGHQAGDHVLKWISSHLKTLMRSSDQLARYGGEEFAVILPMTSLSDARRAAEKLRKSVESQKISYQGRSISITMSFGIASCENNGGIDVDGFLKMADEALYEAKNTGRNQCCYFKHQDTGTPPSATVLVVDDEEVVLVTVAKMMERLGYHVLSARTGLEVVDLLHQKRNKIDMVIIDMVMPEERPEQVLESIRDVNPGIKVVLTSGYDLSRVGNEALLKRADALLQKPYQLAELERIVQTTLNAADRRIDTMTGGSPVFAIR